MDITNDSRRAKKIPIKKLPRLPTRVTAEQRYWKSFKYPIINKYPGSINSVNFSSVSPHDFAIAVGTVVYIYDPITNEVKKTISQFKQTVRCAAYRDDGKLLAAGGDDQKIQLFNIQTRGILRQFRDYHKGSIQDIRFLKSNNTQLLSVSEDKTLRLFDIPTEKIVHTFTGHEDYVRCVRCSTSSPNIVATGSYDHTIKLWDIRSEECVTSFEYDHPVEKLEFFPSGTVIASTCGNGVALRDLMTGKEITRLVNHQKTVTSICFDGAGTRMFSASLDHQVKIYDLTNYKVSHSMKYAAPILDLGISDNNSHLVVGMSDGTMSIRRRDTSTKEDDEDSTPKFLSETHRQLQHIPITSSEPDYVISGSSQSKLRPYEHHLRKFMYKEALDNVLSKRDPVVIISLIEELTYRKALPSALLGRNDEELEPILAFIHKYILNPRFNTHLFLVFDTIIDLYAAVFGKSPIIDELVLNIQTDIENEIQLHQQMFKLLGALELVMTTTSLHKK